MNKSYLPRLSFALLASLSIIQSSWGFTGLTESKLLADDPASFKQFGYAVAVSGHTALVGAPADNANGVGSGAVYVFHRGTTGWELETKLTPDDPIPNSRFGEALAIDQDTIVVGSPGENSTAVGAGAVRVFVRGPLGWVQQARLVPPIASASDGFGYSLALSAGTLVVGVPFVDAAGQFDAGALDVFQSLSGAWNHEARLFLEVPAIGDLLGFSVDIDGNTIIGGAPFSDRGFVNTGLVAVFTRSTGTWESEAELTPLSPLVPGNAGYSVSLSGNRILAGAPFDDGLARDGGAAYLFLRTDGGWIQEGKLTPSDPIEFAQWGEVLALHGDRLVVGSYFDSQAGDFAGAVYLFEAGMDGWIESGKLVSSDIAVFDLFGRSVALDETTLVVGALLDNEGAQNAGGAYAYEIEQSNLPPVADPGATVNRVIAPDGLGAAILLDGTLSSDPDGDPLTFAWFLEGDPAVAIGGGVTLEIELPVGSHEILLVVDDGIDSDSALAIVRVITLSEAVRELILEIRSLDLPDILASQLELHLELAAQKFDAGEIQAALTQLKVFESLLTNAVRKGWIDPVIASDLIGKAAAIASEIQDPAARTSNASPRRR